MMVMSGRAGEAIASQERLTKSDPLDVTAWLNLATLQASGGDVAGYRNTCRAMLDQFEKSADADVLEQVVRTCSLLPAASEDESRITPLAERFLSMPASQSDDYRRRRWSVTRGLAFYRVGRFEESLAAINRAQAAPLPRRFDVIVYAVRVMANHQLGRGVPKNFALLAARAALAGKPDLATEPPWLWRESTEGQIIFRETESLLMAPRASTAPSTAPVR